MRNQRHNPTRTTMPEKRSHAKKLNCSSTKITKKLGTAKTEKKEKTTLAKYTHFQCVSRKMVGLQIDRVHERGRTDRPADSRTFSLCVNYIDTDTQTHR